MSERNFSTTIENELAAANASLALLVYLDWPSAPVRMWTGVGPREWNSQTWEGGGNLVNIDKIVNSVDKSDVGLELTLNYLDDDLRNEIITQQPVGRDASVYLAVFDIASGTITDAYEIFPAFIDKIEIVDAGQTGQISVRLASELARLQRARYFTLSDAHQQFLFPGDKGCEFATKMDEVIFWGRKPVAPTFRDQLTPEAAMDWWNNYRP